MHIFKKCTEELGPKQDGHIKLKKFKQGFLRGSLVILDTEYSTEYLTGKKTGNSMDVCRKTQKKTCKCDKKIEEKRGKIKLMLVIPHEKVLSGDVGKRRQRLMCKCIIEG